MSTTIVNNTTQKFMTTWVRGTCARQHEMKLERLELEDEAPFCDLSSCSSEFCESDDE